MSRENKIAEGVAIISLIGLTGILAWALKDPAFARQMFMPGGGRPLMDDLERTDGVNPVALPGTNAYVVRLRESAQFLTRSEMPERVRKRVALVSGCDPSVAHQINSYADAKVVMPGQDTKPVYIVTVNC